MFVLLGIILRQNQGMLCWYSSEAPHSHMLLSCCPDKGKLQAEAIKIGVQGASGSSGAVSL